LLVLLQDVVSKDVDAVVAALKAKGITKFASVGWCWGACMAVQAAAADPSSFKATAFLHPSMFGQEKDLVAKLQCPLATISTPGGEIVRL
jgi:dienelactone hydrolase